MDFMSMQGWFRVDMTIGTVLAVSSNLEVPFCERPCNRSPTIWGVYSGPLFFQTPA